MYLLLTAGLNLDKFVQRMPREEREEALQSSTAYVTMDAQCSENVRSSVAATGPNGFCSSLSHAEAVHPRAPSELLSLTNSTLETSHLSHSHESSQSSNDPQTSQLATNYGSQASQVDSNSGSQASSLDMDCDPQTSQVDSNGMSRCPTACTSQPIQSVRKELGPDDNTLKCDMSTNNSQYKYDTMLVDNSHRCDTEPHLHNGICSTAVIDCHHKSDHAQNENNSAMVSSVTTCLRQESFESHSSTAGSIMVCWLRVVGGVLIGG